MAFNGLDTFLSGTVNDGVWFELVDEGADLGGVGDVELDQGWFGARVAKADCVPLGLGG